MRDYKYVKVPRSERTPRKRATTRRVGIGPGGKRRGGSPKVPLAGLLVVLLAAAFSYGAWEGYRYVSRSPFFHVAGVDVQGVRAVSDDEVRAWAAMFTGQNIFRVDLDRAVHRASEHPWVKEVQVERSLPNRVRIMVSERTPWAVLAAVNGRFLIDHDCVVIVPVREGDGHGLPTVAIPDWRAASRTPVTAAGMQPARELLEEIATRGGWDLAGVTVRAGAPEAIAIDYAGHEFRIGSGNYPEKLRRLGEIVTDLNRRGVAYTYLDVRPERQAAVMVKNGRGRAPAAREGKKSL
jgi:cell division septal protein FtsQ